MSAAGTAAVSCVELRKVVGSATPFHRTTEVLMKAVPVNVSVKSAPPAIAEFGESKVNTGAGMVTVKTCDPDVPPPGVGLNTVTEKPPENRRSPLGTVAVNCVALT